MRQPRLKLPHATAVHLVESTCPGSDLYFSPTDLDMMRRILRRVAAFCGVEILTYALVSHRFEILVRVPPRAAAEALDRKEILRRAVVLYGREKVDALTRLADSKSVIERHGGEKEIERLRGLMGDLSQFMKLFKQRFTMWFNFSRDRQGTAWGERFKSVLVQDDPAVLAAAAVAVEMLPVVAGVAQDPREYPFCGYGEAVAGSVEAQRGLVGIHFGPSAAMDRAEEAMKRHGKALGGKDAGSWKKARKLLGTMALGTAEFLLQLSSMKQLLFGAGKRPWAPREIPDFPWPSLRGGRVPRKRRVA